MGRKGWGSLNGQNMSATGSSHSGYNSPDADQFDGFGGETTSAGGYQQTKSSSKVSSPTGNGGAGNGGGGGWADWDDDNTNGMTTKTAS